MAGLRACAPVKTKGGQLDRPYNKSKNPAKFRELGESDDELEMDKHQGVIPMPAEQSVSKLKTSAPKGLPAMILPDDQIPSHTFPRPGETIGRKKGKQLTNKCKCCERELTKEDKEKSKYVKCKSCKGIVCELCRDQASRCHECYVQKSVNLDPNTLMEFQRETLLRFLDILHYKVDDFEDYDKAHLVKQLLTRFRLHELWDPRFHSDPLEIEELQRRKEEKMAQEENAGYSPKASPGIGGRLTQSSSDLLDEMDYASHRPGQKHLAMDTPTRKPLQEAARKDPGPYAAAGPLLLQNISTPKYFEDLEVHELRAILNQYGVDSSGERPILKYRVLQLWNSEVEKGQRARDTPSPSLKGYPQSVNLQRTFSLKDIPSSSAVEKLTTTQLKNLLQKYKHNPDDYPHRSDLEYQVLLLWNQAKREVMGIQRAKQTPGLSPTKNWKSQDSGLNPTPKWTSAAAAAQYPKDNVGQQQQQQQPYGGGGHYGQDIWGDVRKYVHSPDQYSPYQDPGFKTSTLAKNPPHLQASYSPDPVPAAPARTRPAPPVPPPLPPPAPHLLKSLSLHDINKPEEIALLSMRQMLELLDNHSVNTDGATDKAHLEDLVKQLWFDKIIAERNLVSQQRVQATAYHHPPPNSSPSPYPMNTSFETQFSGMTVTSKQKYSDGDNSSLVTTTQKTYINQENAGSPYKPYGSILPQDKAGPTGLSTVKKTSQEMCTVCLVRPIDCIILNCGHMVSCMVCVSRMDACPLCHSEIARIINIK